jgi:outer membrane protein assembly factor BamD
MAPPEGGTGVGVEVVNAPTGPAADPNAVVKPVGPANTAIPSAEKPAEAPLQVNEIKPGSVPTQPTVASDKKKKAPKTALDDESSSKKKKKKGVSKLNPF